MQELNLDTLKADIEEQAQNVWCGIVFVWQGLLMVVVSIFWMAALSLHWIANAFRSLFQPKK